MQHQIFYFGLVLTLVLQKSTGLCVLQSNDVLVSAWLREDISPTLERREARRARVWRRTSSWGSRRHAASRGTCASTSAVYCTVRSVSATIMLLRTCTHVRAHVKSLLAFLLSAPSNTGRRTPGLTDNVADDRPEDLRTLVQTVLQQRMYLDVNLIMNGLQAVSCDRQKVIQ